MPTINTHPKKTKIKAAPRKVVVAQTGKEDGDDVVVAAKIKPIIELDDAELVAHIDVKVEDDPLAPEEDGEESSADEAILEEDLDPFGDKYEA